MYYSNNRVVTETTIMFKFIDKFIDKSNFEVFNSLAQYDSHFKIRN